MAPYKALYGRKCCSPIYLDEKETYILEGPEIVQDTMNKVKIISIRLKAALDRQKKKKLRRPAHEENRI